MGPRHSNMEHALDFGLFYCVVVVNFVYSYFFTFGNYMYYSIIAVEIYCR